MLLEEEEEEEGEKDEENKPLKKRDNLYPLDFRANLGNFMTPAHSVFSFFSSLNLWKTQKVHGKNKGKGLGNINPDHGSLNIEIHSCFLPTWLQASEETCFPVGLVVLLSARPPIFFLLSFYCASDVDGSLCPQSSKHYTGHLIYLQSLKFYTHVKIF